MKWNEMSAFHRIVYVTGCLCAVAYAVAVICSLTRILPSVYELSWTQALFGFFWLSQGVINWADKRMLAYLNFLTALLSFAAMVLGWIM